MMNPIRLLGASALLLASVTLPSQGQTQHVKPGYWLISVKYPRFSSKGPVAARANAELAKAQAAEAGAFLANAKKAVPEEKKSGFAGQYELIVRPTIGLDSVTLCSAYVERYEYTGGAHGNTSYTARTYATVGAVTRALTLQDLFLKSSRGIDESSAALLDVLKRRAHVPSSVASGAWKSLGAAQAKRFVVTKQGLLFLFDQGELGASAEGAMKVMVPYNLLAGLNREGVLKQVLAGVKPAVPFPLTSGRWRLARIDYNNDQTVTTSDLDQNWIEFQGGRVQAKAGVNRFNGSFTAEADGGLKFGPLAMTRALNPPGSISEHFEKHIAEVARFLFRGTELILELPYDTGVMVFRR